MDQDGPRPQGEAWPTFNHRLLVSRTVREEIIILSQQVCDNLLQQPQET